MYFGDLVLIDDIKLGDDIFLGRWNFHLIYVVISWFLLEKSGSSLIS